VKSKSKSDISPASEHIFFNKGQKIYFKKSYGGNFRGKDNQVSLDPSEAFQKSFKEYKVFGVLKTPCIQDLSEFISNNGARKKGTNQLLYY
jgi:hypothetical protein